MSIVSFRFLLFLFLSLFVYYIFPKKKKWIVLLVFSILFFLGISNFKLIFILLFGITTTYIGTKFISKSDYSQKKKKIIYILTLISIILPLFIYKYLNIFPMTINLFGNLFDIKLGLKTINLIAPLGMSYYSLNLIGYITDVYWKKYEPENNYFKLILFGCYYPIMISGPIIRYSEMKEELYNSRNLDWNNIYSGFTRIIYGLLKKLVVADLLYQLVNLIFTNYTTYHGLYIVVGLVCYAIQIYCDFSGCMDIVIGASKMYNVTLPENFTSPFYSKNLSEFWRRWHITLGLWGKDYIMYPLLKSNLFQKISVKCRKKFGKKIGKKIPTVMAILILWLIIGLWHGTSYKYIFAAGILPWIYLTIGEFTSDFLDKLRKKLRINSNNIYIKILNIIKVLVLMCFVWLFVCSKTLSSSIDLIFSIFKATNLSLIHSLNILPYTKIINVLMLVAIVDYYKYNGISVLDKFKNFNIFIRWGILFIMIIYILIYGSYGPSYNAVDFIYGGF